MMQIFLTYLDQKKGVKVLFVFPKVAEIGTIENILQQIYNAHATSPIPGAYLPFEQNNFVNYIFEIPCSPQWNPKGSERIMVSLTLDVHQNPKVFKSVINRYVDRIKNESDLYKALYLTSGKTDPKIPFAHTALAEIMQLFLKDVEKVGAKQTGLAELIILGIGAVGKTCIVNRLITGNFDSTIRPTLSTQILSLVYEQMDFQIHDVAGQVSLRYLWGQTLRKPQAIIFVADTTHTEAQRQDSLNEFNRMMKFYFEECKIPKTVPVLILANKVDLNPQFTEDDILQLFQPDKLQLNYNIGLLSALTGQGMEAAFKWLASQIKVTSR